MNINVDAFIDSLPYMAKGMAGIFIVTAVIVGCIYLLNKLTKKRD